MIKTLIVILLLGGLVSYWLWRAAGHEKIVKRWSRRQANVAIYEERQQSIQGDDQPTDLDQDHEVKHQLLADTETEERPTNHSQNPQLIGAFSISLVCVVGLLAYLYFGDPFAPDLESIGTRLERMIPIDEPQEVEELDAIIKTLTRRDSSRHGNVASSTYLIHALFLKQDYEAVVAAHDRAEARQLTSVTSDIERIRAEFVLTNGLLNDNIRRVSERVLEAEPNHPLVLQTYGLDAWKLQDYPRARQYFEQALYQPMSRANAAVLEELVHRANGRLPENHPAILISLAVDGIADTDAWLTVFARAAHSPQPLAVIRRPFVRSERYELILDDLVSMIPGSTLSTAENVRVVARVSPSPDVASDQILAETQSGWVNPAKQPWVQLRLDSTSDPDSINISIQLANSVHTEPDDVVFVIGRSLENPEKLLFSKKIQVNDLPLSLQLTNSDLTVPQESLPAEGLEVFARLSKTGNNTRFENDIESEYKTVKVGEQVRLTIERVVQSEPPE